MKKLSSLLILCLCLRADIKNDLISHWQKSDEFLEVQSLELSPEPKSECEILSYPRLIKQGFFRAKCAGKNQQISFKLKALSRVLVLKKDVLKDEVVGLFDLEYKYLDFSKIPRDSLRNSNPEIRFKSRAKAGAIVKSSMLMPNYLIKKDDSVIGIIEDGELSIFVDLIALQSGVKGQSIRLKNTQGANLSGEILNEKQVLIR